MALVSDKEGSHVKVSMVAKDVQCYFRLIVCFTFFLFFSDQEHFIFCKTLSRWNSGKRGFGC